MASRLPGTVFIIPYRDRAAQLNAFRILMPYVLDYERRPYEILFVHQKDNRNFNRGAMKNIGFLYVKETYPDYYRNMTLVFHDIDTIPSKKNMFDYKAFPNVIEHYYGYKHTLGGIFAIMGCDFEKVNGFPNFWAWGFEDNLLKDRWSASGGEINYRQFHNVFHSDVLCLFHGFDRLRHQNDMGKYNELKRTHSKRCGITTITGLKYTTEDLGNHAVMINVTSFNTARPEEKHKIRRDDMVNVNRAKARLHKRRNNRFKLW